MKKIYYQLLTLVVLLISSSTIEGQNKEGYILYEEVMKFEIELSPEMQQYADMIPTENRTDMILYFTDNESFYKKAPEKAKADDPFQEGIQVEKVMIGGGGASEVYLNQRENLYLRSEDLMGKKFLVKSELNTLDWVVGTDQEKIAGYNCFKATSMNEDSTHLTAWFTPELTLPLGPGHFYGLPGAILKITMQNDSAPITIEAKEVVFEEVSSKIVKPTKGKEVTPEKFEEIVMKRMEEMEAMMGRDSNSAHSDGNGNIEIKVIRN